MHHVFDDQFASKAHHVLNIQLHTARIVRAIDKCFEELELLLSDMFKVNILGGHYVLLCLFYLHRMRILHKLIGHKNPSEVIS